MRNVQREMAKQWTANQALAIGANEPDVCVSAGAGSGKTSVLVERFLRIIRESADGTLPEEGRAGVGDLLVITFTEKATQEMKKRIVGELVGAGLTEQRRQVETAYISTIHGFCSRLLKENPFEAGIDPEYEVLDETEARRLFRNAFESIIERAYEEGDEDVTELVAVAQNERLFGTDVRDPLAALSSAVEGVLNKMRGSGRRPPEIEALLQGGLEGMDCASRIDTIDRVNPVIAEVLAGAEGLRGHHGVMGAMESRRRRALQAADSLRPFSPESGWSEIAAGLAGIRDVAGGPRATHHHRHNAPAAEIEIAGVLERIRVAVQGIEPLLGIDPDAEQRAALLCYRFLGLVHKVWLDYHARKREESALDNEDLQAEAVHLLESSPGVRRRYARRFRYILVDELQDTDPLQMRLIELLHGWGEGNEGKVQGAKRKLQIEDSDTLHPTPYTLDPGNSLFVVGDVQQSIYGFRNADPTIFQGIDRRTKSDAAARHVSLAENFRSRPEILRFINRLFGQIWHDGPVAFTPLEIGADFEPKDQPSVEFLLKRDTGREGYVEKEAEAIASRIKQIVENAELRITNGNHERFGEPIGYQDIAILMRGLTEVEKYEDAFIRAGLPYFVVGGGRGYYARSEIRDIINVLTVLDTPFDDIALTATLRSPMVGASMDTIYALVRSARSENPQEPLYVGISAFLESRPVGDQDAGRLRAFYGFMEKLRLEEDRLPVGQLLERILTGTLSDARLLVRPNGRRRLANVRKLLQMANAASVHGVSDFIRRLREIEKVSEREGDAPTEEEFAEVVRIISIHRAKGLEFPVVFLADMARGQWHSDRDVFTCDPKSLVLGCKLDDYSTAAYRRILHERAALEDQEENRILYVALTRAQEHLILCGSTESRKRRPNWADMVFGLSGIVAAPVDPVIHQIAQDCAARLIPM